MFDSCLTSPNGHGCSATQIPGQSCVLKSLRNHVPQHLTPPLPTHANVNGTLTAVAPIVCATYLSSVEEMRTVHTYHHATQHSPQPRPQPVVSSPITRTPHQRVLSERKPAQRNSPALTCATNETAARHPPHMHNRGRVKYPIAMGTYPLHAR